MRATINYLCTVYSSLFSTFEYWKAQKNNMKYTFLFSLLLLFPCTDNHKTRPAERSRPKLIVKQEFQSIIDSFHVKGVVLMYNAKNNTYYSNNFKMAKKGYLPASTFKIPNSIIGLETGVIKDTSTVFKWDGKKRYLTAWEKDLKLKQAFQLSCVPCYQEVARKIGVKKIKNYLKKLNYGNIIINTQTQDNFWLKGNSTITPFQQIDFLKRFYYKRLPISTSTYQTVKYILQINKNQANILSGKTGLSNQNGIKNGWFVGYVEIKKNVLFFATNIQWQAEQNVTFSPDIRKKITLECMKTLNVVE